MCNRINNRIYYNFGKVHNTIVINPFKQITTFLEISNWFWITSCLTFQLFSCSIFLFIYIYILYIYLYIIFNALMNVYHQGYVVCNLFFLMFFIFYFVYRIHRKKNLDPTLKTKQYPTSDFQRCTALMQHQCRCWCNVEKSWWDIISNLFQALDNYRFAKRFIMICSVKLENNFCNY